VTGISIDFMAMTLPVAPLPVPAAPKSGFANIIAGITAAYPPASMLSEELPADTSLPFDRQDLAGGDAGSDEELDDDSLIIVDPAFLAPVVALPIIPAPVIGAPSRTGTIRGIDPVPVAARQSPAPATPVVQMPVQTEAVEADAPSTPDSDVAGQAPLPDLDPEADLPPADRAAIARVIANAARAKDAAPTAQPQPVAPQTEPTPSVDTQARSAAMISAAPPVSRPVVSRTVSPPVTRGRQVDAAPVEAESVLKTTPMQDHRVLPPQPVIVSNAPVPPVAIGRPAAAEEPALPVGIAAEAPAAPAAMILPTAPTAPAPIRESVIGDRPHVIDTGRTDWIENLVDRIDEVRSHGGSRITQLRLLPDALGTVDVRIEHNGDRVNVHFTADTAQARTLLADATSRLSDLADARGLKLGDTGVQQGPGGQRHAEQDRQDARPNHTPMTADTDTTADETADRLA